MPPLPHRLPRHAALLVAALVALLGAEGALAQTLVPSGATWRYLKGTAEASTPVDAWRQPGFNDATWLSGATGIGYGDGDDATVLADMQGSYASVYMRIAFDVTDPAAIAGLRLDIDYDDGFVAYLNGVEVARRGLSRAEPRFSDLAWDREAGEVEPVPLSDAEDLLVAGTNVLALHVHNSGIASSDLSCDPALVALPHDPASRGPYLQAPRPDSVVVRWRTRLPSTSRVEWGDPTLLGQVTESTALATEHEVLLRGLRPGTRYGYRVAGSGETRSEIFTFWTPPRTGSAGFDVAVVGNTGTGEVPSFAIGRRVRESRPEIVVHAGDAVFPDGRDGHMDAQLFTPLRAAIAGAPLVPAPGEVDLVDGAGAPWREAFTTFANNPDGSETWYSFDVGTAHVTVLDSTQPLDTGTPQWNWLRDDLRGALACWKIVVIHAPMVTSTALFSDPATVALRAALAPLFEREGVDVVYSAHVNAYERSFPFAGGAPTQQAQEPAYSDPEPIYVVAGGGGRPLETVTAGGAIAAARSEYSFARLDVQAGLLTLIGRSSTAVDIDQATIAKTCSLDSDNDGVPDATDNCTYAANADQANADLDIWGDACEPDSDADGVPDDTDTCPFAANPGQEDLDADGLGDACDFDDDGDGVDDIADDCPTVADPLQEDLDRDGLGDPCDDDVDGDTILDAADNCPRVSNVNQTDIDGDGLGNACDDDDDGDGVADLTDNCPYVVNPTQLDTDGDAEGDHCDADDDNDGVLDVDDDCPKVPDPGQEDLDLDGLGDACENDQDGDLVPLGTDCDDRNPNIGGTPEEAAYLRVRQSAAGVRLTWDSPRFIETSAQVVSGSIAELQADRSFARATCDAPSVAGTTLAFATPADDRWYLVRFRNACSGGTHGDSGETPDPRDTLDAAPPCP